jgi:hypothetical protein
MSEAPEDVKKAHLGADSSGVERKEFMIGSTSKIKFLVRFMSNKLSCGIALVLCFYCLNLFPLPVPSTPPALAIIIIMTTILSGAVYKLMLKQIPACRLLRILRICTCASSRSLVAARTASTA